MAHLSTLSMNVEWTPVSGQMIADLALLRCVARGAHGEVWLGRAATGVFRAVKIVRRATFSDPRPFEREFEGLQHFEPISREHVGLMDILHVGRDESQAFFYCVLELADSEGVGPGQLFDPEEYEPRTLHSQLRDGGRMPVAEVIQLGVSLVDAVKFLHARNLVHRDLKPSNIIFCQGIPKLADVGLVTTRDSTRSFVGTTGYVPMEGPGTEFADIYALGKVLYQAATGKSAEDYPELPADAQSWPDWQMFLELNSLIDRACSPKPSRRYKNAAELKAELIELSKGQSVRRTRRRRAYRRSILASAVVIAGTAWLLNWTPWDRAVDSFGHGLDTNRWDVFLTRPYSHVKALRDGLEFESRGGIDSRFPLPNDFEVTGRFRFITQDDHLRICLRTNLKPVDRELGRDGVLVMISQPGEVVLALPECSIVVAEASVNGAFGLGSLQAFRIVCRSNHFEVFMGEDVSPRVSGSCTYSTGSALTLYNRELPGMRLKLESVAIRSLGKN